MYTGIWNALRLPAIVCPVGLTNDFVPLSVQMIASPDNERILMAAAQDIERDQGGWVSTWNQPETKPIF
uniref:Amidase domain-containing protein n=1 Tax=Panagrolaimus davidi TaxID=227884 RepID=A0A914Q5Z7_9BILA